MGMIDVHFDFTTDTPNYWDTVWNDHLGYGGTGKDPDAASKTMQLYHSLLWSKPLPNGQTMELAVGKGGNYLTWNKFRFGSDSITASFRHKRYRDKIEQVYNAIPNYRSFMEDFIRRTYTIGGSIIFPKTNSFNCARGCNAKIKDRWDLSLECIRRFYNNEESPLYDNLLKNKDFFDLFVDFKGSVDFFFLQDCVSPDYSTVYQWIGNDDFSESPLPKTVEEYLQWIEKQLEFVEKRNKRIEASLFETV